MNFPRIRLVTTPERTVPLTRLQRRKTSLKHWGSSCGPSSGMLVSLKYIFIGEGYLLDNSYHYGTGWKAGLGPFRFRQQTLHGCCVGCLKRKGRRPAFHPVHGDLNASCPNPALVHQLTHDWPHTYIVTCSYIRMKCNLVLF